MTHHLELVPPLQESQTETCYEMACPTFAENVSSEQAGDDTSVVMARKCAEQGICAMFTTIEEAPNA